jgi:hypothetical protein
MNSPDVFAHIRAQNSAVYQAFGSCRVTFACGGAAGLAVSSTRPPGPAHRSRSFSEPAVCPIAAGSIRFAPLKVAIGMVPLRESKVADAEVLLTHSLDIYA